MKKAERIIIDPEVQGGKPVIKWTRVPVEVVVNELRSTLEDWLFLGLKLGHPLPAIGEVRFVC